MGAAEVIANYEALAALTSRMHEAARRGDWDALVAIEQDRGQLVAAVKPLDATTELDETARQRKHLLIAGILAQDEEIRMATQSWMEQFRAEMQSGLQQIRLFKEYGA
jgi:flagellar protein FliT